MGKLIPFPGVQIAVPEPTSLDAHRFAKLFDDARAHELELLQLTPSERRTILAREPFTCQICGGKCWPLNGMWWNADGFLHNYECRYPEPKGV